MTDHQVSIHPMVPQDILQPQYEVYADGQRVAVFMFISGRNFIDLVEGRDEVTTDCWVIDLKTGKKYENLHYDTLEGISKLMTRIYKFGFTCADYFP